jgi:hypothetical protein
MTGIVLCMIELLYRLTDTFVCIMEYRLHIRHSFEYDRVDVETHRHIFCVPWIGCRDFVYDRVAVKTYRHSFVYRGVQTRRYRFVYDRVAVQIYSHSFVYHGLAVQTHRHCFLYDDVAVVFIVFIGNIIVSLYHCIVGTQTGVAWRIKGIINSGAVNKCGKN